MAPTWVHNPVSIAFRVVFCFNQLQPSMNPFLQYLKIFQVFSFFYVQIKNVHENWWKPTLWATGSLIIPYAWDHTPCTLSLSLSMDKWKEAWRDG